MEKVIVTGGAGFIGSHLSEALSDKGYQVIIIDNLSTGKIENLGPILKKSNVKFIKGSITDLQLLQEAFRGVRYVFHQAAIPSVPRSIENPEISHEANATGTLNVLLAAKDNKVGKIICASSSSVYGDTPTLPKQEDMPPNPQSPYAVSKLMGEYYCRVFQKVYALSAVCLRYFNVFGPRQDPLSQYSAVIPKFARKLAEGKPPVIFGDGEQTRDFTFVKDVVSANILAAESKATGIFNIGSGTRITINELVKLMGDHIRPVYEPSRPGDILHSLADITRARSFGYLPKYTIAEGLKETIRELK